ncbi:MAG: hypothetical protein IIC60_07485 [Proteobacteria bacterium]|nr:hypothetical protein [Pseudomonadota bacterium]
MISKKLTASLAFALLASTTFAAGPAADIDDLAWMTGNWVGNLGPNTLEENWILPTGGSIASMVRMTGNGGTSMFEVITIEEKDGSLELHIQQWDAGFVPRTAAAQVMALEEIGENRVLFRAVSEGGMVTLAYSRPTPDSFNIDIENAAGNKFQIPLKAR